MSFHAQVLTPERRARDLQAELNQLRAHIAAAPPAPAPPPPCPQAVRIPAPRTFLGVPNEKGAYDPKPRDFTRSVQHYLLAQQRELDTTFDDERCILLTSTFLEQLAATWYD